MINFETKKVLFIDLDGTLIKTISGKTFPEDITVVYIDNYYWIVGLKEIADILHINYVHELQNLLFGLGLKQEMEV